MKKFFSYDKIKNADIDSLTEAVGKKQAKIIFEYFRREDKG